MEMIFESLFRDEVSIVIRVNIENFRRSIVLGVFRFSVRDLLGFKSLIKILKIK